MMHASCLFPLVDGIAGLLFRKIFELLPTMAKHELVLLHLKEKVQRVGHHILHAMAAQSPIGDILVSATKLVALQLNCRPPL
jgi:hypothetical protein